MASWTTPHFDNLTVHIDGPAGRLTINVQVHWDYGQWLDWEAPGQPAAGTVISWSYAITSATGPDGQEIEPANLLPFKKYIDNRVLNTINSYHHES